MFCSFVHSEASDVVPVVSSISAVSSLVFSYYLLGTVLSGNFLWGFLFLVVGTSLIAHFRMTKKVVVLSACSGLLFGIHFVLIKMLFNETNFDNAFFWSRLFISVCALSILFSSNFYIKRKKLEKTKATKGGIFLVILNKALAGIAGIIILKAVELGDVVVVQALSGLQFVFLILFAMFFGHKAHHCVGEHCGNNDRIQKIISVAIIVVGFSLLFI